MPGRELDPQERLDWLRLARTETIGPVSFYALLRRFGSARAALEALPRLGTQPVAPISRQQAERELATLDRLGGQLLCRGEPLYPETLAAVEDAPPVLSVLGQIELLARPIVAVVGARNASANGRRLAHDLAAGLGAAGIVVASGMARGIDAAAHAGALATGTVAVVAGGIEIVYPEENRGLYDALAEHGAVVAEMPLGTEPQARHFPRRNRIISGMALGVVVVEAAAKSGSLITARYALEQGREVFAVPGSPLDPRAEGTNDLIKQGATLVTDAADVIAVLRPILGKAVEFRAEEPEAPAPGAEPDAGERARIVSLLGPTPVPIDDLVRLSGSSPAIVRVVLLELELAGRLERHGGALVSLL